MIFLLGFIYGRLFPRAPRSNVIRFEDLAPQMYHRTPIDSENYFKAPIIYAHDLDLQYSNDYPLVRKLKDKIWMQ